ncbi:type II secretion system minor pseudopilin GspJ [Pseudomonas sp. KU43P]|uniref:type II secretion system minor pseudopilin GspJ n=1 Tax=Pseudomonas sp. KU43P TaxID=2487887 RepID=UPI0012A7F4A7|nr:type II secretion system minor pseudopilin GspJ [Pseudomonas sp. KU43P]BBH43844.1 type II secretion system protein J [Pseudomonas sp. KU43P]
MRAEYARAQRGFTLIELLLAVAIFALLALGSAQLLDSLVRADGARQQQVEGSRALARALSVMQRDALQVKSGAELQSAAFAMSLQGSRMRWLISVRQQDAVSSVSDLRIVEYWLEDGTLWRRELTLENGAMGSQRLLDGVRELRWRVHAPGLGWVEHWSSDAKHEQAANALEVTLSTARYQQLRRVLTMAGGRT